MKPITSRKVELNLTYRGKLKSGGMDMTVAQEEMVEKTLGAIDWEIEWAGQYCRVVIDGKKTDVIYHSETAYQIVIDEYERRLARAPIEIEGFERALANCEEAKSVLFLSDKR